MSIGDCALPAHAAQAGSIAAHLAGPLRPSYDPRGRPSASSLGPTVFATSARSPAGRVSWLSGPRPAPGGAPAAPAGAASLADPAAGASGFLASPAGCAAEPAAAVSACSLAEPACSPEPEPARSAAGPAAA